MKRLRLAAERTLEQDTSATDQLLYQLTAIHQDRYGALWREHSFAQSIGRDWRWDLAYVDLNLAIEVDGGIWVKGAHGHPLTILRNMEKRNWGTRLRWRLLTFTPDEVKSGVAMHFIEQVLNNNEEMTHVEHRIRGATPRRKTRPRLAKKA